MKLLLVQPMAYLDFAGGAHKANRLIMEGLAARGHQCLVICGAPEAGPAGHRLLSGELARAGIDLRTEADGTLIFHSRKVEVWAATNGYRMPELVHRAITGRVPDRVILSEDRSLVLLEAILGADPGPVIALSHSQATLPFGPASFMPDEVKTALFRGVDGIIAVSGYVRDYIERHANMEARVIHSPVYGTPPFPFLARPDRGFVTMINPAPIKGISIFRDLAAGMPNTPFAAVPTWATRKEDRAALEALPNMRVFEPFRDLDALFGQTRILLVPSLWGEAFGQIAVEAMARGIPVLASDLGGLTEAKLGVDYLLPVNPIRSYLPDLDERMVQVPIVPRQDVGPWRSALERLLTDARHYRAVARASHTAAARFIQGLSIAPYEAFLASVNKREAIGPNPAVRGRKPDPAPVELERLSPAKRALLLARLRKKRTAAQAGGLS